MVGAGFSRAPREFAVSLPPSTAVALITARGPAFPTQSQFLHCERASLLGSNAGAA